MLSAAPSAQSARVVEVEPSERMPPVAHRHVSPAVEQALRTVDAERIFVTAAPGPGVPALRIEGVSERRITPGRSTDITVRTVPGALTTFASREGGAFPNKQASITVLADDAGLASTTFTATPGTVDDVYVQAGSPGAIGTVSVVVHVLYPDSPFVLASPVQP